MGGAGKITLIVGGLPVLVAWIAGFSGLPEAHHPVTNVLAEVLAVLLVVLAWRFRQGRLAVAALAIALANFFVRGPLAGDAAGPAHTTLAIFLPITLAVLALIPERPINKPLILALIGGLGVQALVIGGIGGLVPAVTEVGMFQSLGRFFSAPDLARLVFLIAGAFIGLAFAARRGTFEGSLLWVTAASAIALLGTRGPHAATLALISAQLVLLLGLVEDSYRLAYHDELTGLQSRRALEEALRALDGTYAIAMVDVDHFKKFNDRHGHAAGDQALRMVASELQAVGGGGRAYRYGGEEFAILFPGATPASAHEHLENVREAIAGRKFALRAPDRPRKKPNPPRKPSKTPRHITVSVSIGVAGQSAARVTGDAVLRAADRALYRAKSKGRNRVVKFGARAS